MHWVSLWNIFIDVEVDRWRLLEFSTKKYVLFTTYFMSSFQITFFNVLYGLVSTLKNSLTFGYRFTIVLSNKVIPQLLYSYFTLTGYRSPTRALSWGTGAGLLISVFLKGFG